MTTIRLTMAQALVKFLAAQRTIFAGQDVPLFGGVFAIFGHGNVAGLGEALAGAGEALPTYRAHNEQAMAHAAIAFAKTTNRRRMMACTTSVGPGATNMVTAAALAHANRLPVLLLPGDVFANRRPDPVLQQIENFTDPTISANDCFRPVARYWDRITRPEQVIKSLPAALRVLTDPVDCGPAVLCLPQDVQTEAADYPIWLFETRIHRLRRSAPDGEELAEAARLLVRAKAPLVIAGGGVHYSEACGELAAFAERRRLPVAETQAGKGAIDWTGPAHVGAIGVTGAAAANDLARRADLVLAIGSRLQDFTTGSGALFGPSAQLIQLNVGGFDAAKHRAHPLLADARTGLSALDGALGSWRAPEAWFAEAGAAAKAWQGTVEALTAAPVGNALPSDAQVLGAVNRKTGPGDIVVCAAGGLPGELHKLWRAGEPGSYHLEYGYSCMGYEIAGALGVKLARPGRRVVVLVGDGSYLMMNSEIATSVMMGLKLEIVLLDNHGYACIDRLQRALGSRSFNNLLADTRHVRDVAVDFAAHARALGAAAEKVGSIGALESALDRSAGNARTTVMVIETDPALSTQAGGAWWDVPIAEVSPDEAVRRARLGYQKAVRARDAD